MAQLPPSTSSQIADAAGLNERYVREWLGGMTTGQVVEYDPATALYTLPRERAALLTRAAGPDNLARAAQFIPLLGEVEQKIIGCFHNGDGLSYTEYPRFHAVMAETSGEVFDASLVDTILPMADGLPERLRAGADVADFGCGSGHRLLRGKPCGRCRRGATARVLRNIYRALRPGGVFLMVDVKASSRLQDNVGVPLTTYFYTVSTMHCMSVSLAFDGAGLGTAWGRQLALSMLADVGFNDVAVEEIETDPINYYYIATK
jgi:SAM-dependent methyltransferase